MIYLRGLNKPLTLKTKGKGDTTMKRIYEVVDTYTMEGKRFCSLISACRYVNDLSADEKEYNLLGDLGYNYDYMKSTETLKEYYERMKEIQIKVRS